MPPQNFSTSDPLGTASPSVPDAFSHPEPDLGRRVAPYWVSVLVAAVVTIPLARQADTLRLGGAHRDSLERERPRIEAAGLLRVTVGEELRVIIREPTLVSDGLAFDPYGVSRLPRSVPAEAHLRLEIARRWTGRGATIGAITGGVAGAVLGIAISGLGCFDSPRPCSADPVGPALALGALGTGTGAAVGAVVGSIVVRWVIVYDGQ